MIGKHTVNPQVAQAIERLAQIEEAPMMEFRDAIIQELCNLTDSTIAYFYATDPTESYLTLLGYSAGVMAECAIVDPEAVYKVSETGLWGDAIRERGPIITNDYPNSTRPSKHGYPEGHVHVLRHMNMPIFGENNIVAIVGVGNKLDPYTMEDVENVEALMNAVWTHFEQALWSAIF